MNSSQAPSDAERATTAKTGSTAAYQRYMAESAAAHEKYRTESTAAYEKYMAESTAAHQKYMAKFVGTYRMPVTRPTTAVSHAERAAAAAAESAAAYQKTPGHAHHGARQR